MTVISDFIKDIGSETFVLEALCKFCCSEDVSKSQLESMLKEIFNNLETSVKSIEDYLEFYQSLDKETLELVDSSGEEYDDNISESFYEYIQDKCLYEYEFKTDEFIFLDYETKTVKHKKINKRGRKIKNEYTTIINAVPVSYNRNKDVFMNTFTYIIKWDSSLESRQFTTNSTRSEMKTVLEDRNHIVQNKHLDTALGCIQIIMKAKHMFKDSEDIKTSGFYIHPQSNELIRVDYSLPFYYEDIDDLNDNEINNLIKLLKKGIDCLGEIIKENEFDKKKLGWVFRWFLVAPFGFMKKQTENGFFEWLYLWGDSATGKSSLCKIFMHMWGVHNSNHIVGGSSMNTQYRMGEKLRQTAYPVVIEEAQGLFKNMGLTEMMKSCIESTISRSRDVNGKYTSFSSFPVCAITSNDNLPFKKELRRRFLAINFTRDEIINNTDFIRDLKMGKKDSLLYDLEGIGAYVCSLMNNRHFLELDINTLSKFIVINIYQLVDKSPPVEFLEDMPLFKEDKDIVDDQLEQFRAFFLNEVNKSVRGREHYSDLDKSNFQVRLDLAIEHETIDWLSSDKQNNIIIAKRITDDFKGVTSFKSLGSLLDDKFEYKTYIQKWVGGKNTKAIVIKEKDFLQGFGFKYDEDIYINAYEEDDYD